MTDASGASSLETSLLWRMIFLSSLLFLSPPVTLNASLLSWILTSLPLTAALLPPPPLTLLLAEDTAPKDAVLCLGVDESMEGDAGKPEEDARSKLELARDFGGVKKSSS